MVLAGLVTGQNVIADALHQVGVRTAADSWHGMELTWCNILHFVYTTLAGKHLFWPLVLAVVLLLALFAASIRDRQQLARALPLGLCALMTRRGSSCCAPTASSTAGSPGAHWD